MLIFGALHFLRPGWFFAFIPLVCMSYFLYRRVESGGSWQSVCDAHLLPHLLQDASQENNKRWHLIVLILSLFIIALSGPTWLKRPQPVFQPQAATVIVLDLSRGMSADDLKPSRLARARFKVLDLLQKNTSGRIGLIVFSKEPYVVSPLTQDTETITAMIPVLHSNLMPSRGHDIAFALRKAEALLDQGGTVGGHIILLTSGIATSSDINEAGRLFKKNIFLDVLGVGTKKGAPLQGGDGLVKNAQGDIVMGVLDVESLQSLAHAGGGDYVFFSENDSDVNYLANNIDNFSYQSRATKSDQELSLWVDEGYWVLLLAIILALRIFQKNWFLGVVH